MLRDDALKGKTYVVTGGGSGLGKSMTKYLLELGAQVVITSRNLDKLKITAEELEKETGGKVLPLQCDVRDYDAVCKMRDDSIAHFKTIDGLLNNAAGNFISPTERLSSNAFDTIIDIVLRGTKNCTLAFGKYWIEQKEKLKTLPKPSAIRPTRDKADLMRHVVNMELKIESAKERLQQQILNS